MGVRFNPFTGNLDFVNAGDLVGPSSSTDNAIVRFDTTTGKLVQNSAAVVADDGTATFTHSAGSIGFTIQSTAAIGTGIFMQETNGGTKSARMVMDHTGNLIVRTDTSGGSMFFDGNSSIIFRVSGSFTTCLTITTSAATFAVPIIAKRQVTPKTANYTVTTADSNTVFTNEGTTAQRTFTLPTAAAGLEYEFIVQDSDGLIVAAAGSGTIRDGGTVSAAAGNIASTTVGSTVKLLAINATEWIVTALRGSWVTT